jgi:hypothetical protein
MTKAIRQSKRKLSPKPVKRSRVGVYERHLIEAIVASTERAHQLTQDTWHTSTVVTPLIVSAVLRDLLIEIGAAKGAANNLAEAFLDRGKVRP